MVKKFRCQRRTLLVVGEGDCEVAFLKHLRNIYCADGGGVNVTIRNAQGGGPDSIVNQVIRYMRLIDYDWQVAFLDTDLVWSDKVKKNARKNKIVMVGSRPYLEGMLLNILKHPIPSSSDACKKNLQSFTKFDMTEWHHYEEYFSKVIIEGARFNEPELDTLLRYFEGI